MSLSTTELKPIAPSLIAKQKCYKPPVKGQRRCETCHEYGYKKTSCKKPACTNWVSCPTKALLSHKTEAERLYQAEVS